ncbi:secretogranin-2b [Gadus chalcogrammus]|uniref:secretogranin-2b n=1 Tax=Gadus chalcogrammus TaxID=1042646 RepID=UPI0024C48B22|nr:secretogranin-2b [Gadus chalcogrammus]
MLHLHLKCPAGGAAVLALLLHAWVGPGASLPRHHRFRGGDGGEAPPAAYPPNSDMMKALEYIENLKQQRNGGGGGAGGGGGGGGRDEPMDYDEVDKFRVLLQLASLQDEGAANGQPQVPPPRPDVSAEQLVKALLKTLQDQAGRGAQSAPAPAPAAAEPRNDRRAYRHRTGVATGTGTGPGGPVSPPSEFGNFPRPHKKYPLMFEDEENRDAYKRATEDLDEQYTPQSLANLRSIFEELGRMPTTVTGQRRELAGGDNEEEEEEEEMFNPRNLAYEDVAGGEDWLPMEEREETEEVENRSHEEFDRGLPDGSDQDELEREELQRRASQNQEDSDDDTKLVDYYLLKVLEMSDQTQKRDQTGDQKQKRLIRPSILDPRTVKELLQLSLKLHVPPQDLIDMLITEEIRKLHRHPQASPPYRSGQTPKIRYYSRRLPLKNKPPPEDMDREDFLDIIGVETISNEYPVIRRPAKPISSMDKVPAQSVSVANSAPAPAKVSSPSGRRENLFLSELNKMPFKRERSDIGDDDDDVEDEVTTYLAAKILTEYPNPISKRDTQAQRKGPFPYELYEQAMKDYLDQVDTEKVAKRELEGEPEDSVSPTENQSTEEEALDKTSAPQTVNEEEKPRGKQMAGM